MTLLGSTTKSEKAIKLLHRSHATFTLGEAICHGRNPITVRPPLEKAKSRCSFRKTLLSPAFTFSDSAPNSNIWELFHTTK